MAALQGNAMLMTIILCVVGLSLIGVGGYFWYQRHIEDESSFGHDDVRWEQIDADDASSVGRAVSDIDQLTDISDQHETVTRVADLAEIQDNETTYDQADDSNHNVTGREHIDQESSAADVDEDIFGDELDQLAKLVREDEPEGDLTVVSEIADIDEEYAQQSATVDELRSLQDRTPANRATLPENPEMVVSVHVVAKSGREFHGSQLLEVFNEVGLQHGDRDIFHSYDSSEEGESIQFSAANMVEPGTFDPTTMEQTNTNGVTLFMLLPGENNNVQTFESLLDVGHQLAKRLGGELRDSQRGTLTSQGANLIKESIHEFSSKRQVQSKNKWQQGQLNL